MFDLWLENTPLMAGLFFILGACLGSFANVVIYRLPAGESVVSPGSRCPQCQNPIRWFDNVPVLAWIWLRGRCRKCETAIPFRYPLVEFLTGFLFVSVFLVVGWKWVLLEYLVLVFGLVVVTFIDLDLMILPDSFTLPGIGLGLLGGLLNPERTFLDSFFGVLLGGGFLWAIANLYYALRKQEGLGGGDIKLLAWMGAILGWKAVLFIIFAASMVGSIVGIVAALRTKGGMQTAIPFGPYLALGGVWYILGGEAIAQWYLSLFLLPPLGVN